MPEIHDDAVGLREGRVDPDPGHFEPCDPEPEVVRPGGDAQVAAVPPGHAPCDVRWTARCCAAPPRTAVQQRGSSASPADRALGAQGLSRPTVTTVGQTKLAARAGLLAPPSERMARAMAPALGLDILAFGSAIEPEPVVMAWCPRPTVDPAHARLRETLPGAIRQGRAG